MKYLLFLFLPLFSKQIAAQDVATFDMTGAPGNQASQPVSSFDPNIMVSDVVRGSGILPVVTADCINSYNWATTTTQDPDNYYEFTLTPNAGYDLVLSSLNITFLRSNAGPKSYNITYMIAGSSETSAQTGTISGSVPNIITPSLSISTSLPVRFRVYAWGGTALPGTFRLNAVSVQGAAPLPVKLVSFKGRSSENVIVLEWTTTWEDQNEGFEILGGINPVRLEELGFVPGHLTTDNRSDYFFTDSDVKPGQAYYYRLRQKDLDGSYELSQIIAVQTRAANFEKTKSFIFPNPSHGTFNISEIDEATGRLKLVTEKGTEIPVTITKSAKAGSVEIGLKEPVPTGVYYLLSEPKDAGSKKVFKVAIN